MARQSSWFGVFYSLGRLITALERIPDRALRQREGRPLKIGSKAPRVSRRVGREACMEVAFFKRTQRLRQRKPLRTRLATHHNPEP